MTRRQQFRMNNPIMKYSLGTFAVPLTLALVAGASIPLEAQQPRPRPGSANPPASGAPRNQQGNGQRTEQNPITPASGRGGIGEEAQVEEVERLPEALETILKDWEKKSSQIKSLHGKHTRTVYNLVFQEEKIAHGKFFLQTPDKGRIDLDGQKQKPGAKSARLGQDGEPFRLVSDRSERWICTGNEVVMVDDEQKTFQVMPLPASAKGTNIINTPLPFLFGMKAEDAKRRFHFQLSKDTRESAILIIYPKQASDQENYKKAFVILDKATYLPTAVKLFDPSNSLETVYKFESVNINDSGFVSSVKRAWGISSGNPYYPDLKGDGYKLILPPAATEPAPNSQRPLPPGQVPPVQAQRTPQRSF